MNVLEEKEIMCPYCGELFSLLIDCSVEQQRYIEDCQVCCQPIVLDVEVADDNVAVYSRREDE